MKPPICELRVLGDFVMCATCGQQWVIQGSDSCPIVHVQDDTYARGKSGGFLVGFGLAVVGFSAILMVRTIFGG